ncbi:MAG TPA: hypothetical protein VHM48_07360 [Candidatus Limnocylindrales bacterium]|nr:hypothetical protein [Candidatus Limnocylindrales bacterium]
MEGNHMATENPGDLQQPAPDVPPPPVAPAPASPAPAPASPAPAPAGPAFNLTAADFKFTRASIVMVAAGIITVVGYFLPWASVSGKVLGQNLGSSVAGSDFLVALLGIAMIAGGAVFAYHPPQFKIAWIAVGIIAIIALVVMLRYFGDYNNAKSALGGLGGLAGISVDLGLGFLIVVVGAIVAIVGAALGRGETLGRRMF